MTTKGTESKRKACPRMTLSAHIERFVERFPGEYSDCLSNIAKELKAEQDLNNYESHGITQNLSLKLNWEDAEVAPAGAMDDPMRRVELLARMSKAFELLITVTIQEGFMTSQEIGVECQETLNRVNLELVKL